MELFEKAKVIRLRSHHDKYLLAEDDQETVSQDRNGTCKNAKWTVEIVENQNVVRFKSCYGKYLTASNMPFLLGMTGKKVLQTLPSRLDSSLEWEPSREGFQVRLKTRYGQFLRANGGVPPWRNQITHDIPHRTATQDWILWDVDVVEIRTQDPSPVTSSPKSQTSDQVEFLLPKPKSPPRATTITSPKLSRLESDDSFMGSPVKNEGRVIYYTMGNEDGDVDGNEELSFTFKGSMVDELKKRLEEETGLSDIHVCSRNPLNARLYPLRLHLPPNNASMRVIVLPSSAKGTPNLATPESPPAI